jgi:diaminopimelate epimerase
MKLDFTKMQGAGNDFVVLDATHRSLELGTEQYRHIADRRFGIGCDQVLLIENSNTPDADFRYRIFNADGGEVEQCGNGVRCVARYLRDAGLTEKEILRLASLGGTMETEFTADGVRANMGVPVFTPRDIPFDADTEQLTYGLDLEGEILEIGAVSMGNPHAVIRVHDLDNTPVRDLGEMLESHPRFPKRVNVGFMQVVDSQHIRLRVFERGVGETLACGTGACAAAVWGRTAGLLDSTVNVDLPGGRLMINWLGKGQPVLMSGPATTVFTGEMDV